MQQQPSMKRERPVAMSTAPRLASSRPASRSVRRYGEWNGQPPTSVSRSLRAWRVRRRLMRLRAKNPAAYWILMALAETNRKFQ